MNTVGMKKGKVIGHALILASLTLAGCTKERAYKEVYKDSVYNSGVKEGIVADEFIYVPSQVDAPHSTNGTMPGAMGQERIVRFHFTEKALVAETVIEDERFSGKTLNAKPVLSIPVDHVDYRCADNGAGECSNQEEEINNVDWKLKKSFKPTVDGMQVTDANTLPIELDTLLGENCHSLLGTRVVSADFQPDSVQIEVEKTYRSNVECLTELDSLSDLTFNVRQIHSFVKRTNLVSKNYEPIPYPQTDENTFGFFSTSSHRLSVDYSNEEKGEKVLMNRWNPTRKIIPYSLTENFNKPENAALKEATLESIEAVNNALKEAKVDLQIEVSDKADAKFADIRNSMIVLIEDPQAGGVLGYGPSIADPRTGEIISARVVMYAGTLRSQLSVAWNEFVDEEKSKSAAALAVGGTPAPKKVIKLGKEEPVAPVVVTPAPGEGNPGGGQLHAQFDLEAVLKQASEQGEVLPGLSRGTTLVKFTAETSKKFQKELMLMRERFPVEGKILDEEDTDSKRQNQARTLAKYNYYPIEMVNIADGLKLASLEGLKELPRKVWADLSESEQEQVVKVMLPFIWVPTLVHEIGHNLGLRHNFSGSEDKANFYSAEELKKYGHAHAMEYSSVMDYSYKTLNELRVMGKYDVAALRYAYNREVEQKNGKILKLTKPLAELSEAETDSLKEFKFCTDGNVGVNPGCRRFDQGTTLTEIAQNLLEAHEERYKRRNLRNGRRNFSITTDKNYVVRIADLYSDMRQFFELYDMVQTRFNLPETNPAWIMDPFLRDLKSAVMISRQAMLDPAKVPSTHCVIESEESGKEAVPMEALGGIYPSCSHPAAVKIIEGAGYKLIGQFGRQFNSEKFATSTNPYADQIDVRGYWADKLLGPIFLTTRLMGISSFDKYTGNFLDRVGGTIQPMIALMDGYLMNEVTTDVDVQLPDGSVAKIEGFKFAPNSTHRIAPLASRGLRAALRMPNHEVPFSQVLLTNVLMEMWNSTPSTLARAMRNYYGIAIEPKVGESYANYDSIEVDGQRYYIHKRDNVFALGVYNQISVVTKLEKIKTEKRLIELLEIALKAEKEAEPTPAPVPPVGAVRDAELTEDEKAVVALGSKRIEEYLNGEYQSSATLRNTIRILGEVNMIVRY